VVPTCSVIYNASNATVYSYDFTTNASTLLDSIIASSDIAHTSDKMWLHNGMVMYEYDITLSPWSYTFNRIINLPYGIGAGLGVINNTTLISSDGINSDLIIEIDITTTTAVITPLFALTSGRVISGDLMYTTSGKLILTSEDFGTTYLSQYNYSTGSLEVDVNITAYATTPYGVFQDSGLIYVMNSTGTIYNIPVNSPYTPVLTQTMLIGGVNGASQVPSCLTGNLIP
jgi:hypothetical protein